MESIQIEVRRCLFIDSSEAMSSMSINNKLFSWSNLIMGLIFLRKTHKNYFLSAEGRSSLYTKSFNFFLTYSNEIGGSIIGSFHTEKSRKQIPEN